MRPSGGLDAGRIRAPVQAGATSAPACERPSLRSCSRPACTTSSRRSSCSSSRPSSTSSCWA
eukprot:13106955-Alexandrium_andersonii.AAC.1